VAYWRSRGLRGSELEALINITNDVYRKKNLAVIQKIPTPITPIKIDKTKKVITLAYFDQKSTVDYIGVAQGTPICFDAKETTAASLPLANIHQHQVDFMNEFAKQNGVAFLIVYFKRYEKYYLTPIEILAKYFVDAMKGGRKSIPYNEFANAYEIEIASDMYLHYLKAVQKYIDDLNINENIRQ